MNINDKKGFEYEIDIIDYISDKENESYKFYSELSEDSNNFSISSDNFLSAEDKLEKDNKESNQKSNTNKKNISKIEKDVDKGTTKDNKNLLNNLLLNKKSNDDSSSSSSDNSSNNPSNSPKIDLEQINEDKYDPINVNIALKNIIINHKEIAPEIIDLVDNDGNGNCLFYCLSYHFFQNFNHHKEIRNAIANRLNVLANEITTITLTNNQGKLINIKDYVKNTHREGEWAGDAEISMIPLVYDNIRVACYQMVKSSDNNENLGYRFINNYGNFNDDNISILLLIHINNNHYLCGYYNAAKGIINDNFTIPNQIILEKKNNLISKSNQNVDIKIINNNIKEKYNNFLLLLNDLKNFSFEDTVKFYSSEKDVFDFSSIYYYLKTKQNNNNEFGEYPPNLKLITKNKGNRTDKKNFKLKCKNYSINNDNVLIKLKEIKKNNNINEIVELKCVPLKYRTCIMYYFHNLYIHCGYIKLVDLILNNKLYWKNLNKDCNNFVNNCDICIQTKKNIYKIPKFEAAQGNFPNELIHMDLSDIPESLLLNNIELKNHKLAVIVENLSKYAFVCIIENKAAKNVLPVLIKYINVIGKPSIILTDNGTEFVNELFDNYLSINNIEHRKSRPYNPACNGVVERFIKTLKDLLLKKFINDKNKFDLNLDLEYCLNIYNNKKHSVTKFEPFYLIKSKDKKEWEIAKNNINKNRKRNTKNSNPFKSNQTVLISTRFIKKNNKLGVKKFAKKGTYSLPAKIIKIGSSHEYWIKFSLSNENLGIKKNFNYLCDYRLIKECSLDAYNTILSKLKDN